MITAIDRVIELGVVGNTEIGWLRERVAKRKIAQLFAGPFSWDSQTRR